MPSAVRKESQLAIYRNEKPFPSKRTFTDGSDYFFEDLYKEALANWFSTSERFEVHPEEEEKFIEIVWPYPVSTLGKLDSFQENLKEGIEIPDSCYEVRDVEWEPISGRSIKHFAYFVPPSEGVGSHANKTEAGKKGKWTLECITSALGDTGDYTSCVLFKNGIDILETNGENMENEDCQTFVDLLNLMPDLWSHRLDAALFELNLQKKEKRSHEEPSPVSIGDSREGNRAEIVEAIKNRIEAEYRKHKDYDWAGFAAIKIYRSLFLSRK